MDDEMAAAYYGAVRIGNLDSMVNLGIHCHGRGLTLLFTDFYANSMFSFFVLSDTVCEVGGVVKRTECDRTKRDQAAH